MNNLFIALIHYPVTNKKGEKVITSITPFDVHDIARSALSFGVQHYYVVNPSEGQKKVVERLINFWNAGFGKTYNPNRTEALSIVSHQSSLDKAMKAIEAKTEKKPYLISTSARLISPQKTISLATTQNLLQQQPVLILFGTGWGLAPEIIEQSDAVMEPVYGISEYNHLSVRAAAAIILYQLSLKKV